MCFLSALWHFVLFEIMKIKINDTLTFEAAAVVDNLTDESLDKVRAAVLHQLVRLEDLTLSDFLFYIYGEYTLAGIDTAPPDNMPFVHYVWLL